MAVDIAAEVIINRPRESVAAFAMNVDNDPVWIGGIVEADMVTEPPLAEGSRVRRVARFLGRRMDYTYEVNEYEPTSRIVMRTGSPFEMGTSYEFEDRGEGTLVRIHVWGQPTGLLRLGGPLLGRAVKRNVTRDLAKLKQLLESRADHDQAARAASSGES